MTEPPAGSGDLLAPSALVDDLGARVLVTLAELMPHRPPVAILDIPTTANWGDNAIWIGERAAFARLGTRVAYEADDRQYDRRSLDRHLDADGVVMLHGGGSIGDLYPKRTAFRRHVLSTLRDRRIIHLPQSIHFEEPAALEEFKRLVGEHPSFTLLARDQPSFDLARTELDCEVLLCPDMAFAMGSRSAPAEPTHDVLWIDRLGPEAVDREAVESSGRILRTDWRRADGAPWWTLPDVVPTYVSNRLYRREGSVARAVRSLAVRRMPAARQRTAERFLSQGRVILTDRLHGHILGLILGRPTVVLDNRIGKPRAFYDTWTHRGAQVWFAESATEGVDIALAVAGGAR